MAVPIGNAFPLPLTQPEGLQPKKIEAPAAPEGVGKSFGERVKSAVVSVDAQQKQAAEAASNFAEGKSNDIHNTMLAAQQAEISLRLMSNARTRFVEMYHEVMRMGS